MKKKNLKTTTIAIAVLSMSAFMAITTGCVRKKSGGDEIDSSKTQLYIKNYQGGYGNKWLYSAKAKYEELHKNDSFESGKQGVQIIIADQKARPTTAEIKNGSSELYFFEGVNYHTALNDGAFEEITEYVTGNNPYESGKTIESKMYEETIEYLNMKDSNGNSHYYAIPHYSGCFGIVYNKTVFRDRKLFFADGYENFEPGTEFRFVESANDEKSAGPDGIKGTSDDGLPVTYDEFYELCNYIVSGGNIPLVWMGKNGGGDYFGSLVNSLATFHNGATQSKVNYWFDGTINVAKLNDDGSEVLFNDDGTLMTENVTVHPEKVDGKYDGYEVNRMSGKYHGLDFLKHVMDNVNSWKCNIVTDSTSHLEAQSYFINSQFGRLDAHLQQRNKSIAMIFEGDWWESEASEVINSLADEEKTKLDFGWMPLPRADASSNTKQTLLLDTTSYVFIKKGLNADKKALAGDFIQFCHTDESLREFTTITNAIKCFKYNITDEDKAKMSKFGLDFWNEFHNADKVFPNSHLKQYVNSYGAQLASRRYTYSTNITFPQTEFKNNPSLTASKYVAKMYKFYKDNVWKDLA